MKPSEGGGKKTRITIENEQDTVRLDTDTLELITRTALECIGHVKLEEPCDIGITLVNDPRIRELNKEFRQIDSPTDVLSFPILEMKEGVPAYEEGDFDRDTGLLLLGDVVISLETAGRQALEYGHPFERELAFLTSHGVFHLLGFDHIEEGEAGRMFENQEKVLEKLGLKRI